MKGRVTSQGVEAEGGGVGGGEGRGGGDSKGSLFRKTGS
jgi:hypothetical protein